MSDDLLLNGRFLGQRLTGVQRYARAIAAALDADLAAAGRRATLLAPAGTPDPGFAAMRLRAAGPLSGHPWEQLVLPRLAAGGALLNLGNTAPVAKTRQVVCLHDANVFITPESYGRAFRRLYHVLHPMIARRAARIATVSEASARQLARHLPLKVSDIAVLPNGHEHALAWDPALAERAPARVGGARPFVLALGSRARHKNLGLLTAIAPALEARGIDIVIAGEAGTVFAAEDGPGPAAGTAAGTGARTGAGTGTAPRPANLTELGRVSDHDLAWLMDRALCLAFPSWTEGFGLPLVEAMARGCPVVSSDRASLPEVCGTAALMASPADPAAWVERITRLAAAPELACELVGRGHEQVRRFSWAASAAGYRALMDGLGADGGRRAAKPPLRAGTETIATAGPAPDAAGVAVIVATRGRPAVVSDTVRHLLATQSLRPATVIISCNDPADAGALAALPEVRVVTGPPGLPAQRNTGLAALPPGIETVAFFDDDFVCDPGWLAAAAQIFRDESSLVALTGEVLADGIKGAGIPFDAAVAIVAAAPPEPAIPAWTEPFSPYGCNMAYRVAAIGAHRFDERLVLYGWLEDRDFAAGLARAGGRCARAAALRGVHMGVKSGRVAGDRLGYSQIANPVYMLGKKTMTPAEVAGQIFRNVSSNLARAPRPEAFVDRRGRLRGNLMALGDIVRGRIDPERAARIGAPPAPAAQMSAAGKAP
ncbi:glycosyltransferase [Frigidibacter sp. MR17.24]|uniref:glycosyltransferase n=1 Tax=Frigidibacter sp. MR17.24 TaxID=3127345 RepID=UPI003012B2B1